MRRLYQIRLGDMMIRKRCALLMLCLFAAALPLAAESPSGPSLGAEYYGEIGCSHCDDFAGKILPEAEVASGVTVELELIDILSASGYRRCEDRLAELGYRFTIFPVLIMGSTVYQGNAAIEANLLPELEHFARFGELRPQPADSPPSAADSPSSAAGAGMRWTAAAIFLAGLVDGINPCAFTTLLFFLSYLGIRGRTRKRIALAGLSFAAGVFLSYFLIGLGLFNAFRVGGMLPVFRTVLRVVVSALTVAFCALTVRDIVLARRGAPGDMALRLPESVRLRINASIRGGVASNAFLVGVFATGVVVSVLELACTGQVYFPAISFMVQTDSSWLGTGSLLLYNLAFIAPLLIVLALALAGLSQEAVRGFFTRHLVATKLALAAVFASLSVLVWIF
ncbi:MAG: hypothetical protein E4H20_00425 [Spirochaetales bacterium]|nr:MAG: hypothetical protein E4H20_00425 [Spirochaetales bacterium]